MTDCLPSDKLLRREFRKDVAFGFDLEKAFDTVLRELTFALMRWMEFIEAEVRMVEEMSKETAAVVRMEGETEQFGVGVGLRQGSALSPLLFIMVMNLISGKVSEQEELKKILYADDLWQWWLITKRTYKKHCKNGVTPLENMASEWIWRRPKQCG